MGRPNCPVKNCKNKAMVAYGSYFICGECLMRIIKKESMRKNKEVEELVI